MSFQAQTAISCFQKTEERLVGIKRLRNYDIVPFFEIKLGTMVPIYFV